jgi:methylase of polypeptide subunit release factors
MRMIERKKLFYIALFAVLFALTNGCTARGHFYKVELFKNGNGWGYDILVNNKPYIHQPFIPALEGQVPFGDKESARKTARLVVDKLKNHKSPGITREELNSIINKNKLIRE